MRITKIDNFRDFTALKGDWDDLLQRSSHTVFSTWEWLSTWWKYFGNGRRLVILLAEEDNRLLGIAPLMYSIYSMFGLRQGKIEFIGSDYSNTYYNDFIIEHKQEKCIPLFFDYIQNLPERWVCAELRNILQSQSSLSNLTLVTKNIKPHNICLYTPLPKSNETFLKRIGYKDRKEIRRYLRRIERSDFKIELVNYSKTNSINNEMNTLFALNQKRWNAKGSAGAFPNTNIRSFYIDIANYFLKKGWLGLYSLKLSGKTVATLFGFKYMNKYIAHKIGIDPEYSDYNIGNLLFLKVMYECIQDGLTEFDFGWGLDAYKKQWDPLVRWTYKAIISKKRPFSAFKTSLYYEYWHQGERLKYFHKKLLKRSQ